MCFVPAPVTGPLRPHIKILDSDERLTSTQHTPLCLDLELEIFFRFSHRIGTVLIKPRCIVELIHLRHKSH